MNRFLYLVKQKMCGEADVGEHEELQLKLQEKRFHDLYTFLFCQPETNIIQEADIEKAYQKHLEKTGLLKELTPDANTETQSP